MTVYDTLEEAKKRAKTDKAFCKELLDTRGKDGGLSQFCRILNREGYDISAIDLVNAGEESYAAMRRSTNGGGENSPLLAGEDDLYEMFLVELEDFSS
ncbi:MAG: hypothetical protein PUG68_06770 [Lachnospiraceae bacterium]|nr:hypothetical protein [Lachnospiraceae bacterium]MDD7327485.1 hypothetical protein [Lachnospiraceae bacterium]MDY2758605.1 hypothetical protein [Lachnospiraceae bacterium]